ncbi:hypothetical protein HX13_21675 [Chryseobacterium sp. P1-3]|nr:hypothetical protein HX13_21675 [Chryseobacterium sp. P1-3]
MLKIFQVSLKHNRYTQRQEWKEKNKLHIIIFYQKNSTDLYKKPKQYCKQQNQTYEHHIVIIKIRRVNNT